MSIQTAFYHLSDSEINLISENPKTVLYFRTDTCGLCKKLQPELEKLADTYSNSVEFFRVDADKNPLLTQKYGIRSVPALIFIEDGETVGQVTGYVQPSKIDRLLEDFSAD